MTFSVFLAKLIGIGVTSQTLRGAILSNIREFALAARARHFSMGSLRMIVMELSFWAGVVGTIAALLFTGMPSPCLAAAIGLPIVVRPPIAVLVCIMMMVIAILSGAMAMGASWKKSQRQRTCSDDRRHLRPGPGTSNASGPAAPTL